MSASGLVVELVRDDYQLHHICGREPRAPDDLKSDVPTAVS